MRGEYLAVGDIFVIDVLLSEHFADSVKHHVHVPGNLDGDSVHSRADSLHRSLDILKHKIKVISVPNLTYSVIL